MSASAGLAAAKKRRGGFEKNVNNAQRNSNNLSTQEIIMPNQLLLKHDVALFNLENALNQLTTNNTAGGDSGISEALALFKDEVNTSFAKTNLVEQLHGELNAFKTDNTNRVTNLETSTTTSAEDFAKLKKEFATFKSTTNAELKRLRGLVNN